ncbi:sorbosone dehydrogenase family protein [Phyllobacterium sp. 21LDTY02-6]|uniref:PQQ-dependent sugar dehydrogenase n=1 Tax=Phyllobacterium sp. 21LDTY02-6 TaxID=2944903 RepID=UPI0020222697|nr:sorbosone dehydrogenase family protein [Phyllobacterium sp. 21LDTY02-6]MCO4316240.1 sorbosone dehydrogenase family protein [Phyllobacterium sp. 21LDTY02-6]
MKLLALGILILLILIVLGAAGVYFYSQESAKVAVEDGYGPDPVLPAPNPKPIPTVNIARIAGWAEGATPEPAPGLRVNALAGDLQHPRWLHVLPNGDVLVAESDAPAKEESGKFSIREWVAQLLMRRAGARSGSADRITLLRDADNDGVAEIRHTFLEGLNSPFGMTLSNGRLFIANTDAIVAVPYADGDLEASASPQHVSDLPGGPINHHWTKDVIASPDGKKLYATVGSNSNVGENGMAAEKNRANVLEIDLETGAQRVFASGLRNPNGLSWNPDNGALWVAVNERDEIGSDLVPDYMTSVKDGGFYGWPYSYYGQTVDVRVKPQNPDLVARAIKPDYALGAHTASLGLAFNKGMALGPDYANGAFVGQHGSWNRKPRSGYKVIYVPFENGQPSGRPKDVLTGFVDEGSGKAFGRPVGVAIARDGALLVADDAGNKVWRVTARP